VNVLGAHVARQCLEAGLLDDVLVFVAQVLLGDGTRLGEWSGRRQVDLVPPSVLPGRGAASLWHDVFPPSRRVTTRRALGVRFRRLSVRSLVTCRLGVRSGCVFAD
jgi:hypothetical protein